MRKSDIPPIVEDGYLTPWMVPYNNVHLSHRYAVHVSCKFGVLIWDQELVDDGGHAKIHRRIPSLGIKKYCRDNRDPPVAEALGISGIWSIKEYIQRRQANVAAQVD